MKNETFKALVELATLYHGQETLNEITLRYQQTGDEVLYSKVVVEQFPFLLTVMNQFFKLTEEDKMSFMLEAVEKAMRDFDSTRGTKIQTLMSTYVRNKLRAETEVLCNAIRKLNYESDSYEAATEEMHEEGIHELAYEQIDLLQFLASLNITESERVYCIEQAFATHQIPDAQLAKDMGYTPAGINYIKKALRKKLEIALYNSSNLQALDDELFNLN